VTKRQFKVTKQIFEMTKTQFKVTKQIFEMTNSIVSHVIYLLILFELNIVYFFSSTRVGYFIYIMCVIVFILGRHTVENVDNLGQVFWLMCTYISCYVISSSILLLLLMRFKKTKQFICNYVSYDYVVSCMGNPGLFSSAVRNLVAPLIAIVTTDTVVQVAQNSINYDANHKYIESCKEANIPVKPEIVENLATRQSAITNISNVILTAPSQLAKTFFGN
jgi:hypothetical protein